MGAALLNHLHTKLEASFGLMWPGPNTLANEVDAQPRSVRRSLRRLLDQRHFVVAATGGGAGRRVGRTTRYVLGPDCLNGDRPGPLTMTDGSLNSHRPGPLTVTDGSLNSDRPGPLTVTDGSPDSVEETKNLNLEQNGRAGASPLNDLERDWEQWLGVYPHKVGIPDAKVAYLEARARGVGADELLAGVVNYVATTPADRKWLNPANYINRERWRDQPALLLPINGGARGQDGGGEQRLSIEESTRRTRLFVFERTGHWSDRWGPRPDTSEDAA